MVKHDVFNEVVLFSVATCLVRCLNFLIFIFQQDDDDDSDDEDDTAELLAELQKIKKERASEQARKVNKTDC